MKTPLEYYHDEQLTKRYEVNENGFPIVDFGEIIPGKRIERTIFVTNTSKDKLVLRQPFSTSEELSINDYPPKLPMTTGVTGTLPVANGGTGVTTKTGTGAVVLSTSPTLVTPILGTPTSGTLTNCTLPFEGVTYDINAQTGTTYTFVLGDAGDIVTSSNAATVAMTIPPNSSVAFPIGSKYYSYLNRCRFN
jgi:hypothetical protein